jgi:tetratricopeptide (TPR) repeat protein
MLDFRKTIGHLFNQFGVSNRYSNYYHDSLLDQTISLNKLSQELYDHGDYQNAYEARLQSLEIYKKIQPDSARHAHDYQRLGEINRRMGDYDESIDYLKKSLELNHAEYTAYKYYEIANAYAEKGDSSQAQKYAELVLPHIKDPHKFGEACTRWLERTSGKMVPSEQVPDVILSLS